MNAAISTALSGLTANRVRLLNSASNVANAQTRGAIPSESSGSQRAYQAVTTQLSTDATGGVRANTSPADPSYLIEYDPNAPYANGEGYVAAPNVDLAREAVEQIVAEHAYKANIATIKTAEEMERSLLDLKA